MKKLTTAFGSPVDHNQNIKTAGKRGPALLENVWFIEKMAYFDREVIPERRVHAKGAGAFGTFTVTHDITKYTKAKMFSEIGMATPMFARFSTVAGERGAADAERDIRGFALKFYTVSTAPSSTKLLTMVSTSKESSAPASGVTSEYISTSILTTLAGLFGSISGGSNSRSPDAHPKG
jgi:hypothetical protein